jgi:hypothetical protein
LGYEGKERKEREDDFNGENNAFFFPGSHFLFPFLLFSSFS